MATFWIGKNTLRKCIVKDLGWLTRRMRKVTLASVVASLKDDGSGYLIARFSDGVVFVADFASYAVLVKYFLKKRMFKGVNIEYAKNEPIT